MKELKVQHRSKLPVNLLQKFWIHPNDFQPFLRLFQEHELFFSVDISDEGSDNLAVINAINEELDRVRRIGGPTLQGAGGETGGQDRLWEFLSCRQVKVKPKDLRGQLSTSTGPMQKMDFIEIRSSSKMLSPFEYRVDKIVKAFGFKNMLREDRSESEKFVAIGA